MDCSLPGSSVHRILQARTVEWVAIPSSRGSSWPTNRTWVSCTAADSLPSQPPGKPWMPHEMTANQKTLSFSSVIFSYSTQLQRTISWLDLTLDEKRISYNNWLDWGEPPEHSQSQACTKKSQGHCLVVCWLIHYSSLNPSEPSQLRSVLSKSMRGTDHSAPAASPAQREGPDFPMTMPDCTSHNQHAKSWTDQATEVCLTRHIHLTSCQPTTTSLSISTTCAGKTLPQPAGGRKCFPRVHQIPKHGLLCSRNKQTYFSLAKMCWL